VDRTSCLKPVMPPKKKSHLLKPAFNFYSLARQTLFSTGRRKCMFTKMLNFVIWILWQFFRVELPVFYYPIPEPRTGYPCTRVPEKITSGGPDTILELPAIQAPNSWRKAAVSQQLL